MIHGDESPEAAVLRIVPVISHDEIVILAERVGIPYLAVNENTLSVQGCGLPFIIGDHRLVGRPIFSGQIHRLILSGNDQWRKIIRRIVLRSQGKGKCPGWDVFPESPGEPLLHSPNQRPLLLRNPWPEYALLWDSS